jgi:hypothetical protein
MADNNKKVEYQVSADPSGFEAAMGKVASGATGAADKVASEFKKIGSVFEEVQKKLLLLAGVVAGGAFFKEAINESNKLTGEVMGLARTLGITAEEASVLNTALNDIGTDSETYTGAFQKFAQQIKKNEDGLKEMGLKTRDANGNLRDSNELFTEALGMVKQYKPGLDQTTAAMTLFGKSVDDAMKLQKLNNGVLEEAKRKNEELGLTITQGNVTAAKEYKAAMNDVGDVMLAVKKVIGDAVMPFFTELANYFASTGPYVVGIFRGAVTGLMLVFRSLQLAVRVVVAVIAESFNTMIDLAKIAGEGLRAAFNLDGAGVQKAWDQYKARYVQGFTNVATEIKTVWSDAVTDMTNDTERIWGKGAAVNAPKSGNKRMGDFGKAGGAAKDEPDKRFAEWKAALEQTKEAENNFFKTDLAMEEGYWQKKLALVTGNTEKDLQVRRQINHELYQIHKEMAVQDRQLAEEDIAQTKRLGDQKIALERERLGLQTELGVITKEQELRSLQEYINREYALDLQALQDKLKLYEMDRVARQKILNEIEILEGEHRARLQKGNDAILVEQKKQIDQMLAPITAALEKSITGVIMGTQTLQKALKNILQSILGEFISMLGKKAAMWLSTEVLMTTATAAGTQARTQAEEAAQGTSLMGMAAKAIKSILNSAFEAFAGIFGFLSPLMGPAAAGPAAAGMATVAGVAGSILSARGGYDVPAGINPMTQLHEREMVLPAEQADAIRGMAAGGGGGGDSHFHFHTPDPQSFARWLKNNASSMSPALRSLNRNFTPSR